MVLKIDSRPQPENISRMMMRYALPAILVLGLCGSGALQAQAAVDSGTFVVRRGRDTVAREQFVRTATQLQGTLHLMNPSHTSERYSAVLAPDATLPLIEVTVREGIDSGSVRAKIRQRARVIFKEDSAAVDEVGESGLVTRVFGTEVGAVPYLNLSFALLEQAVRRARANGGARVPFFNLGGGQTLVAKLAPLSGDSIRMDIGDTRIHLKLDGDGRLLGGRIPVQDLVAERE
jgi:hypothetical protein